MVVVEYYDVGWFDVVVYDVVGMCKGEVVGYVVGVVCYV